MSTMDDNNGNDSNGGNGNGPPQPPTDEVNVEHRDAGTEGGGDGQEK